MTTALQTTTNATRIFIIARDIQRHDAVGNFCVQMAKLLNDAGFDARLAAENCHPDDREQILTMPGAVSTIDQEAVVVFHFSTYDPAFGSVAALRNPKIVYFHNLTPEKFFRGVDDHTADLIRQGMAQRGLCAEFDVIMANSRASAEALCADLDTNAAGKINPEEIVVCPPVIGFDRWNDASRTIASGPDDRRLILFVGRLVPHKGINDLIDGFAHLAKHDLSVDLAIVGGPGVSPHASQLKNKVRMLSSEISERITFFHDIHEADLKSLYQRASVCASMSRHEGFGVPVLDAIAFDKPLVIRSEPGMEESAGPAALTVETVTPEHVATALSSALYEKETRDRLADARSDRQAKLPHALDGHSILKAIDVAQEQYSKNCPS